MTCLYRKLPNQFSEKQGFLRSLLIGLQNIHQHFAMAITGIVDFVAELLILADHPRGSSRAWLCSRECSACHGRCSRRFTEGTLNPDSGLRGAGVRECRHILMVLTLPTGSQLPDTSSSSAQSMPGSLSHLLSSEDHMDHLFDYRPFLPDSAKPDTIMSVGTDMASVKFCHS